MRPNQLLADSIDSTNSTQNYLPKLDYPQPMDLPLNLLVERCSVVPGVLVVLLAGVAVAMLAGDEVAMLAGDTDEVAASAAAVVEVVAVVVEVVAAVLAEAAEVSEVAEVAAVVEVVLPLVVVQVQTEKAVDVLYKA